MGCFKLWNYAYVNRIPNKTAMNFYSAGKKINCEYIKKVISNPTVREKNEIDKFIKYFDESQCFIFSHTVKFKYTQATVVKVLFCALLLFIILVPMKRRWIAFLPMMAIYFVVGVVSLMLGIVILWNGGVNIDRIWAWRYVAHYVLPVYVCAAIIPCYCAYLFYKKKTISFLLYLIPVLLVSLTTFIKIGSGSYYRGMMLRRCFINSDFWWNRHLWVGDFMRKIERVYAEKNAKKLLLVDFDLYNGNKLYRGIFEYENRNDDGSEKMNLYHIIHNKNFVNDLKRGKYKNQMVLFNSFHSETNRSNVVNHDLKMFLPDGYNGRHYLFMCVEENGQVKLQPIDVNIGLPQYLTIRY